MIVLSDSHLLMIVAVGRAIDKVLSQPPLPTHTGNHRHYVMILTWTTRFPRLKGRAPLGVTSSPTIKACVKMVALAWLALGMDGA
jgi:hypothetical protein